MERRPQADWNYDEAEIRADGVIHVTGVSLAIVGAWVVIGLAIWRTGPATALGAERLRALPDRDPVAVGALQHVAGRTEQVDAEAPRSRRHLPADRRHVYTVHASHGTIGRDFLLWVWCVALVGFALKLVLVGRYDRLATLFYLVLGWSGLAMSGVIVRTLSPWSLALIFFGGLVYSVGVVFHLWERLRFQNAIWHACVLAAAATHYGAVLITRAGRGTRLIADFNRLKSFVFRAGTAVPPFHGRNACRARPGRPDPAARWWNAFGGRTGALGPVSRGSRRPRDQ